MSSDNADIINFDIIISDYVNFKFAKEDIFNEEIKVTED